MAAYTKTVDPNGGSNYASLSAWEAGEQGLYASGDIAVADCKQSGPTKDTIVTLAGWNAGVKAQIIGNPAYGLYYMWDTTTVGNGISIGAGGPETTLELLDIKKNAASGSSVNGVNHASANGIPLTIKRCVIHNCRTSGINASTSSVYRIENCFIYANGSAGIVASFGSGGPTSVAIDNCTIAGNTGNGINRASGTVTARNCYSGGNTSADYTGTITKTTCASSDATGTAGLQSITFSTANFANVTSGSEDLHLVTGSALIGAGTDLSGTFTTDFDGVTRTGAWDIGADQYVASGPTPVYSDLAIKWDMFQTVSSDLSVKWDLLNSVQSDLSIKFDALNSVFADLAIPWDVYQTVDGDLTILFDIRNTVQSDLQILWDSAGTVFSDLTLRWDLGDVGGRITIIGSGFRRFIG